MKLTRQKLKFMHKLAILGCVFLILFVLGYYTGFVRGNCEQNKQCFLEKTERCSATEYLEIKNNNVYRYIMWPSVTHKQCNLKISLERVSVGAPVEYQNLEGASMKCTIAKKEIQGVTITNFDNLLQYCHGELKEKIYEIIIQRMYENVVSQLGDIIIKAEQVLGR